MDGEEVSLEAADFTIIRKTKRKKSDTTNVVDDGKLKKQLLRSNSFGMLTDQSNASKIQQAPVITSSEIASGKEKLPPLVVMNVDLATLHTKLDSCKVNLTFKLTRFGTKINCSSLEAYNTVQNRIQQCGFEYYTYDKPNERPYRVVIRGLPLVNPDTIKDELKKQHDLQVQAIHIIKRKGEYATMEESFYLLHFPKGYTNLKKLREIKHIGQIIVRWEVYRNKRADVTQCMKCLYHGHGTRNCHLKSRCNNCSENHDTEMCPTKDVSTKRCANCSGAHAATDRSCPKRAEYIRIRQQASIANQPGRKTIKKSPAAPTLSTENFPALPKSSVPSNNVSSQPMSNIVTHERRIDPRIRAGLNANIPNQSEEVLYSSAELWAIFTEFRGRLQRCKSRSDQVEVLGYMICKYGVN